jgi:hypothetical protein
MSYTVIMSAEKVDCKISLLEIPKLVEHFESISITTEESHGVKNPKKIISLTFEWEEDDGNITGVIEGDTIILDSEQQGAFNNSSDGGLSWLLETYKGDGVITESGEDSDTNVYKYTKGSIKKGRVVFED